ncbi:MAG: deoxyribose-phosphate aldolase [Candidatus Omnitrophota bacterium]
MTVREIAQLMDHSLLHPALSDDDILRGCELARQYEVKAVCIKPYAIPVAKEILKGSPVAICSVVGFPHGNSTAQVKLRECQDALAAGAHEIDMVINIGKAHSGAYDYVKDEIRALNRACARTGSALKVIFENDFLDDEQIIALCQICTDLNVAYVKTSTGFGFIKQPGGDFNYKGATEYHVKLMRRHCAAYIGIKASGGIRTLEDVRKFQALGCSRIGSAATFSILDEAKKEAAQG